jgi:formate dehydrogenase subunit delta
MTIGPSNAESHGTAPGDEAHFAHVQGGGAHLAQMANDIGNFFRSEPDHEDAITGIADHIAKYSHVEHFGPGESGLDALPLAAVQKLLASRAAAPKVPPGGDAG